ncbi:MAG: hypothetical protein ACR2FH_01550 [Caulobacteraceae bacterium]
MKTAPVTVLTSPDFKAFLGAEARREGDSVAELIRARCERRPSEEEADFAALTAQLRDAVIQAKAALSEGLGEARAALAEFRAGDRKPAA